MSYEIAVLIPCFNEELTIENVINSFDSVLQKENFSYKIYVYDNNSTDNTKQILSKLQTEKIIYRKEYRQGKGHVVCSMFKDIDADCYILVDGDGTYFAQNAPEMISYIKNENYDMVVGNRLIKDYDKENKRLFHSFGNRLVSYLINKLFRSDINDIMSGYRAFSKKFVKTSGLLAQGFEVETEITILALDGNYKIKEIPIDYKDRIDGSKSKLNTYSDGIKILKTIFVLFKDYKAFEFFISFCIIFTITTCALFVPIFIEFLETGLVPRFPTLFISIFFALLAILSFCIGTILSTITKLHKREKELFILNYK